MSLELAKRFMDDERMCVRDSYADDYTTTFPEGDPLSGDAVCATMHAFTGAAPDFSFNTKNWSEDNGVVKVEAYITATMTNDLVHPQLGTVPATGKKAALDVERITLTFKDGKVASMVIEADGPAGPPELIRRWTS